MSVSKQVEMPQVVQDLVDDAQLVEGVLMLEPSRVASWSARLKAAAAGRDDILTSVLIAARRAHEAKAVILAAQLLDVLVHARLGDLDYLAGRAEVPAELVRQIRHEKKGSHPVGPRLEAPKSKGGGVRRR